MRSIVINTSYGEFCESHKAFVRLRELGQAETLQEPDKGKYWPQAAPQNEPSLNQSGKLVSRDDLKLVQIVKELGIDDNCHTASLKIVEIS